MHMLQVVLLAQAGSVSSQAPSQPQAPAGRGAHPASAMPRRRVARTLASRRPERPAPKARMKTSKREASIGGSSWQRTVGQRAVGLTRTRYESSEKTAWHSPPRSEEHTSELQSPDHLVCRLLLEKKKTNTHSLPTT